MKPSSGPCYGWHITPNRHISLRQPGGRLWQPLGNAEQRDAALLRYDALFRGAMEANGGHTYKKVGISFQVALATSAQAVAAAVQAERDLYFQPTLIGSADASIGLRIALHTGVTDLRDGGYVGPLLNKVARVLATAHAGHVLLTQATAELLRDYSP